MEQKRNNTQLINAYYGDGFIDACKDGRWTERNIKCMLDWMYGEKRRKLWKLFQYMRPKIENIRHIIREDYVSAMGILASYRRLTSEAQEYLLNHGSSRMRKAYNQYWKFDKRFDVEFVKKANHAEVQLYLSRYGDEMDDEAYNIAVNVKKLNPRYRIATKPHRQDLSKPKKD